MATYSGPDMTVPLAAGAGKTIEIARGVVVIAEPGNQVPSLADGGWAWPRQRLT